MVLQSLIYFFAAWLTHLFAFRLESNLRKKGIEHLMNASFYFFDVNQSGRIRKIIDDNATDTHMIVAHLIPDITLALITPILLFVIMFSVDIYLGIATVILTILSAIFTILMYGDIKFMDKYNKSLERVNSESVEYVRGMQVLKIFKASIFSFKSFYDSIIDYSKSAYEYSKSCKNPFVIFQIILLGAGAYIIPFAIMISKGTQNNLEVMIKLIFFTCFIGTLFSCYMRIMYLGMHQYMASQAVDKLETLFGEMEENGIKILIGIVCIRDNVRQGMQKTVSNLNKAGVQVVMVTGDRKETAIAIAKDAGIISKETDIVLTHDELSKLSDEEVKKIIPNLKVVSRALPMDKKRLVNLGQSLGLVCGMTGDGINDSPSLKTADVGFSMGDGTEVAREASDIVILNNSLSSIEKAVLNGRTMTKSVQKFIIFQLTVNVATILISILSPLFGIEEPFSIVQILWINLIMDTLASLSFSEEPALDRYMKEQPVGRSENVLTKYMKTHIGTAAIFISIVSLAILNNWFNIHKIVGTDSAEQVRTFMFTFFIYAIIFNSLNTRSTGINVLEHITSNKKFIYIIKISGKYFLLDF